MNASRRFYLTTVLMACGAPAAHSADALFTCSYQLYENGQPIIRRVQYDEPSLDVAKAMFERFLDDLRAQGRQPQHLGCR